MKKKDSNKQAQDNYRFKDRLCVFMKCSGEMRSQMFLVISHVRLISAKTQFDHPNALNKILYVT